MSKINYNLQKGKIGKKIGKTPQNRVLPIFSIGNDNTGFKKLFINKKFVQFSLVGWF